LIVGLPRENAQWLTYKKDFNRKSTMTVLPENQMQALQERTTPVKCQLKPRTPEGTTPAMPQNKGAEPPPLREEDVRNRKVDPEAVRESFKEAELDPRTETEPEEGEAAA
jgi:hypothetical protein